MMIAEDDEHSLRYLLQLQAYLFAAGAPMTTPAPSHADLLCDALERYYFRLPEATKPFARTYATSDTSNLRKIFESRLADALLQDTLDVQSAMRVLSAYVKWKVGMEVDPVAAPLFKKKDADRYIIADSLLIRMKDGARLSAIVVRKRPAIKPLPVVLLYNIYPHPLDLADAKLAADKGYVGVVVNTRGKHLSPQEIEPFEHDGTDAYEIIDWISRQPWCNGKVGMYGGSYSGFAQWSAVKKLHPALKTIVPQVSVAPGIDFPIRNGSFGTFSLRWLHYVTNNKESDREEFFNMNRWNRLFHKRCKLDKPFHALDTLDGRPNAIFQRWIRHPDYDSFWQAMIPYREEFSKINIPVLTITGYYDDDQRGAFYYLTEHIKWNPEAKHYLLVGPYDHYGAQGYPTRDVLGYTIDSIARINISEIVWKWFDHTLKGGPLPAILKDRINFEVMDANEWRSAPTLSAVNNDSLVFYLGSKAQNGRYPLQPDKPAIADSIVQERNFLPNNTNGTGLLTFIIEPLKEDIIISGSYEVMLHLTINKRDMDIMADLSEEDSTGEVLFLSYYYARASYTRNRSKRNLLTPGVQTVIPIRDCSFVCKKIKRGKRLRLRVGMPVDYYRQINYGTGKDVSDETSADGRLPIRISWSNNSRIKIPILK